MSEVVSKGTIYNNAEWYLNKAKRLLVWYKRTGDASFLEEADRLRAKADALIDLLKEV